MIGTAQMQFIVFVPLAYLFARIGIIASVWYCVWIAEPVAVDYAARSSARKYRKR